MKIAWKLTIIYCLIFSLIIIVFSAFFYFNTKRVLFAQHRKKLVESIELYRLKFIIRRQHYIGTDKEVFNNPFRIDPPKNNGVVYREHNYYLFVRHRQITAGEDITSSILTLEKLKNDLITFSIAGVLISILIGYLLSRNTLTPIRKITATAREITAKNLHKKIDLPKSHDELWELTTTINDMLDRIEQGYTMQEQFVADVSHELKTPITSILGYVRLLQRWGKKDEKVLEESLETIGETAENMKYLIAALLELARTHEKITVEDVDIEDMLEQRKHNYEKMYPDFKFEISVNENPENLCSSTSLLEILLNILVENGVNNSNDRKEIHLGWEKDRFFVRDFGKGISEDEQEKIFQRFYKTDKSRKTRGHGLGLALAKKISVFLNMKIEISSKPEEGATFYVIPEKKEDCT